MSLSVQLKKIYFLTYPNQVKLVLKIINNFSKHDPLSTGVVETGSEATTRDVDTVIVFLLLRWTRQTTLELNECRFNLVKGRGGGVGRL